MKRYLTKREVADNNLPTLFRGCMFDADWEFDAPCIVYSPIQRNGIGGNSYHIDEMVDDYCIDLSLWKSPRKRFSENDLKEFKWRGWSPRGFAKRREAWHVEITVRWYTEEGELYHELVKRRERFGIKGKWSIK